MRGVVLLGREARLVGGPVGVVGTERAVVAHQPTHDVEGRLGGGVHDSRERAHVAGHGDLSGAPADRGLDGLGDPLGRDLREWAEVDAGGEGGGDSRRQDGADADSGGGVLEAGGGSETDDSELAGVVDRQPLQRDLAGQGGWLAGRLAGRHLYIIIAKK